MEQTMFATKGNLLIAKNALKLSKQGYELLDKKRNILINEMMGLIDRAQEIQVQIDKTYTKAYAALQRANISLGISTVKQISQCVAIEDGVDVKYRSVMGVEIPEVTYTPGKAFSQYDIFTTSSRLDEAYVMFGRVKDLTIELAGVENAVYRLAGNIKKTQKRANSLKNIMIPRYERITAEIASALEEKDREEFTRLKVIKRQAGEH